MLTIIIVFFGVVLVGALIYVAMASGTKGGRHNQSGSSAVNQQHDEGGPGRPVV